MPQMITERQLRYMEYVQREAGIRHQNTQEDQQLFEMIKAGDLHSLDYLAELSEKTRASHCSDDPLRNAKYLCVAMVTMAGRAAMSVGMDTERSNIASDLFIQRVDKLNSIDQINAVTVEMVRFYTLEVAALDKQKTYSRNVVRALDHIYEHLHEPLTVESIADHLGLSRGYFSTLFKHEMGLGVGEYVMKKRLEAARNMLLYSDMSYSEISQLLAFSSQSHFIHVFKKHEGMTPHQFRSHGKAKAQ